MTIILLSLAIYLTLCTIIIYTKPEPLFTTDGTPNNYLWLFFTILAIIIYAAICIFM